MSMTRVPRVDRRMWLIAGALAALVLWGGPAAPAGQVRLLDLENRPVDPLHTAPETKATVLLFVTTDCPISNRYAPEVAPLFKSFASKGVSFWLICPSPAESPQAIRDALAKLVHATVTPEAVVVAGERVVYRGRVDDRDVALGGQLAAPTRRDLEDALTAVLAGKAVQPRTTQAVGCVIADLLR